VVLNRLLRAGETKLVRRLSRIADHVDTFEADVQRLSDAELRAKTEEFRARHADGDARVYLGREAVVQGFTDFTTEAAHSIWRKK